MHERHPLFAIENIIIETVTGDRRSPPSSQDKSQYPTFASFFRHKEPCSSDTAELKDFRHGQVIAADHVIVVGYIGSN
jgi:hypothetical protein